MKYRRSQAFGAAVTENADLSASVLIPVALTMATHDAQLACLLGTPGIFVTTSSKLCA